MKICMVSLSLWVTLMLTLMFFYSTSPISLVIMIILLSFNLCVLMKWVYFTSWFSYILFLIFLGGLMVLFTYICSLASNEQIHFNFSLQFFLMSLLTLAVIIGFEMELLTNNNNSVNIEPMFSDFNQFIIYVSIAYLLLTLFVSVQLAKMKFGPVRTKKM